MTTLRLKIRYGRELIDIELPDHECTLNALQSKLELATTVKPSHQRLIGPKGVLIKGKLVNGGGNDSDAAEQPSTTTTTTTVNQTKIIKSTPLSEIGIKSGMQLLLVGAKGLTATANMQQQNSIHNKKSSETQQQQQQFANLSNLLVVPQPDPSSPDTTLLKCSYSLGYVNQAVYVCLTCLENGTADESHAICSSCANVCHEDHECVYWGIRRATRCDCCTTKCIPTPSRRLELLTQQDAASTVLKARCKFLADETTHVAPSLPLPANTENVYPPFPHDWCACEIMTDKNENNNNNKLQEDSSCSDNNTHHHSRKLTPASLLHPHSDKTETQWGQWVNTACVGCGQNYWTNHLQNLSVEALACQPCQGSQTSNAVGFYCRTCSGFTCIGCRFHCHKHHDIDCTPYLYSSTVGGFVDPLREPVKKDDDEDEDDNEGSNSGNSQKRFGSQNDQEGDRQEYFSCCCSGRCSIVGQVALQSFYDGVKEAKEIISSTKKPEDELSKRDDSLLHPSVRSDKTVLRDPLPQSNASLLIDDYSLFLCGPCTNKNLEREDGVLKPIMSANYEKKCFSSADEEKQKKTDKSAIIKNTDLIASRVEEQKDPECLFFPPSASSSSENNDNNNNSDGKNTSSHGTLLPQIYFEWLRVTAKLVCGCRDCDIRFETQLPGARRLDEGPVELSVLVGGRCSNCTELLDADGTYLCMTCEREQVNNNNNSTAIEDESSPRRSYELCKNCHETRRNLIHPADHEFELQTLGNTLRQVFALVDAEGDAATRQWLREQLNDCQDPVALLETIVSMMTGRVRLEDSERSLRDTVSKTATSYDDYSDEDRDDDVVGQDEENDDDNDEDDLVMEDSNGNNNNNGGMKQKVSSSQLSDKQLDEALGVSNNDDDENIDDDDGVAFTAKRRVRINEAKNDNFAVDDEADELNLEEEEADDDGKQQQQPRPYNDANRTNNSNGKRDPSSEVEIDLEEK